MKYRVVDCRGNVKSVNADAVYSKRDFVVLMKDGKVAGTFYQPTSITVVESQ